MDVPFPSDLYQKMENNAVNTLINKLTSLCQKDSDDPFAYEDCWKLIDKYGERYQDLTADLNSYFMDIAGYCGWGQRIATWPKAKIWKVRKMQSKSFFGKYPHYQLLSSEITLVATPTLYSQMAHYEEMRLTLQKVLIHLYTAQQNHTGTSETSIQEAQVAQHV